jgi:hypothetical protein
MYYSDDHAALLPEGVDPLPMPETNLELLWILAALCERRRRAPVPCGPLVSGARDGSFWEFPFAASLPTVTAKEAAAHPAGL